MTHALCGARRHFGETPSAEWTDRLAEAGLSALSARLPVVQVVKKSLIIPISYLQVNKQSLWHAMSIAQESRLEPITK